MGGSYTFNCEKCDKSFSNISNLRRHQKIKGCSNLQNDELITRKSAIEKDPVASTSELATIAIHPEKCSDISTEHAVTQSTIFESIL